MNRQLFKKIGLNEFKLISENELIIPDVISATYKSTDGVEKTEQFTGPNRLEELKKFINTWVGLNGDISETYNYIVSNDGVGIVAVKGIDIMIAVGRPPKPKLLPAGYVKTLGEISMKLVFPNLTPKMKIEPTWGNLGLSFVFDWNQSSKDKMWPGNESCRFVSHIQQDEYDAEINASVSIFRYTPNTQRQIRDFDGRIHFKSQENREEDLKQIETLLLKSKAILEKVKTI